MAIGVSIQAVVSTGTLAVVSLWIIPFLGNNAYTFRKRKPYELIDPVYQDEDGVATKESQQKYSVRIQKHLLVLSCVTGAALALTDAIQITVKHSATEALYPWLYVATWVSFEIYYMMGKINSDLCSRCF